MPLNVISVCTICHISQFYANKLKQYMGYKQLYHMHIGGGNKTLLLDMHKRPCVLFGHDCRKLANVANTVNQEMFVHVNICRFVF